MGRFLIIPDSENISESISLAAEYGLGFEFNDFFLPQVLADDKKLAELYAFYNSLPLPELRTSHGDFFDVIPFSEDKVIRQVAEERVDQSIKAAFNVGAEAVIFHTNINPQIKTQAYLDSWYKRCIDFWGRKLLRYPDMNIYIENMFDYSPKPLEKLAKALSSFSNFGVCLDYAHVCVFGNDTEEWVTSLSPYVKHLHINDNDLQDDLHLAVGDGKIDWEQFRKYYMEYFSHSHCTTLIETKTPDAQRRSLEYLRKLGVL